MDLLCCLRCPCKCLRPACVEQWELEELRYKIHRQSRRRVALLRLQERQEEMKREKEREERRVQEKRRLHQQFGQRYGIDRTSFSTDDGDSTPCGHSFKAHLQRRPNLAREFQGPRVSESSVDEAPASGKVTYSPVDSLGVSELGTRERKLSDTFSQSKVSDSAISLHSQEVLEAPSCSKASSSSPNPCFEELTPGDSVKNPSLRILPDLTRDVKERCDSKDKLIEPSEKPVRPKSLLGQVMVHQMTNGRRKSSGIELDERAPGQRHSLMSYRDWLKEGQSKSDYLQHPMRPLSSLSRSRSEPRLPQANARQKLTGNNERAQAKKAQKQAMTRYETRSRSAGRARDHHEKRSSSKKREKWKVERKCAETSSRTLEKRMSVVSVEFHSDVLDRRKDRGHHSRATSNHVSRSRGRRSAGQVTDFGSPVLTQMYPPKRHLRSASTKHSGKQRNRGDELGVRNVGNGKWDRSVGVGSQGGVQVWEGGTYVLEDGQVSGIITIFDNLQSLILYAQLPLSPVTTARNSLYFAPGY
ncbi:serine/arginine-rich splicing factor 4-like [Macrobrachium rosenbergii]|uniref:serine/arginine-rich splicing factor 4-like n=1 Tax=Macrobrachium rosenbergii TaxID=79674 RepID=UPI0034D6B848